MSSSAGGAGIAARFTELKRRLRVRSEHALRLVALDKLGRRYPGRVVPSALARDGLFWRLVFVPLYQRVPWSFKRKAMRALKMTAQGWAEDARQFGEPWHPPTPNGRTDQAAVAERLQETLSSGQ
jgi:hypothetical protein